VAQLVALNLSPLAEAVKPAPLEIDDVVSPASFEFEFNVASLPVAPTKSKVKICPHPTFVEKTKHSTSDERTTNKREEKNGGRKKVVVGESKDCFFRSVG
jgi:hypothetical protein